MAVKDWVVFTDLDGTLLDHHSYRYDAAQPALQQLQALGVPLILNSSKTRPEMERLKAELGNPHPFIVENGAALIVPPDCIGNEEELVVNFAGSRQSVLNTLQELRQQGFAFKSFADFSVEELAEETGLPLSAASDAKQRVATEPLLWLGPDRELEAFTEALKQQDLQLLRGGRFLHVMGYYDKAEAMQHVLALYQTHWGRLPIAIALGDSPNDQKMLEAADYAIVVKGVNSERVELTNEESVIRSKEEGPKGWNECILNLLAQDA